MQPIDSMRKGGRDLNRFEIRIAENHNQHERSRMDKTGIRKAEQKD